jgi:hypothetical protein
VVRSQVMVFANSDTLHGLGSGDHGVPPKALKTASLYQRTVHDEKSSSSS